MSVRSRIGVAWRRLIRPLLVAGYSFFTYRSYSHVFGKPLLDWKPDVVHAHDGVTLPTAVYAAEELGAKLVFDSHELEAHRSPPLHPLRRWQVEKIERRYLPRADRVMTVTELAADYLASAYNINRPQVIFNAPPARPGPVPLQWDVLDRDDVRSDLYLGPRTFLFAYTGNVTLNRGLELAIIALSKLQGYRDPNGRFKSAYHLAIIGKAQSGHNAYLKDLVERYGLIGRVHQLAPVAPHRVASYIATANASIIPIMPVTLSYEYAMPNKLFEAMLSGNPIIASDLMEMGPMIHNEKLGLTYSAESPDDCMAKMVELVDRYSDFERGPQRQRELEEKYAWEAQEKKLLAMYEDMLSVQRD